jgi:hypothetical protein
MDKYNDIDEVLIELMVKQNELVNLIVDLVDLQNHGVKYVDENYEPIIPDNVVHFPAHKVEQ